MDAIKNLLRLVDLYADRTGLNARQVSWKVFQDTNKIDRLRDGADLTTKRHAAAVRWFSSNWPVDLAWPVHIVRPKPDPLPVAFDAARGSAAPAAGASSRDAAGAASKDFAPRAPP